MPTNGIVSLSSADLNKAAALQSRIEQLQAELAKLLGGGAGPKTSAAKPGRRRMTEAGRRRLSAIAKARWKKAKAAGKSTL